jgi:hypothetical protein
MRNQLRELLTEFGPQLITMLIETVSKGGNLLLNVGPKERDYCSRSHRRPEYRSGHRLSFS